MSSSDSVGELVIGRVHAAAERIHRRFEETIERYDAELERQRRLLDISRNPQIQLHNIALPKYFLSGDVDKPQERSCCSVKLEEPELLAIKEQQEFSISHTEDWLSLKQETDISVVTPNTEDNNHIEVDTKALHQYHECGKEDPCGNGRNCGVKQEEPETLKTKEQEDELCISLTEEQLGLKQEPDTLVEVDLKSNQSVTPCFCATVSQDSSILAQQKTFGEPENKRNNVSGLDKSAIEDQSWFEYEIDSFRGDFYRVYTKTTKVKRNSRESTQKGCEDAQNNCLEGVHVKPLHPCGECGKYFKIRSHLSQHMRTHTGEKPFSCTECGKSFSQSSSLSRHLRTHTGEKPLSCKDCDSRFWRPSDLREHMRTHTDDRPFSCEECEKRFRRRSDLIEHMRTHTGVKPYSCKECDKSFTGSGNLIKHMRTHTGEKPFSCKECQRSFCQRVQLLKHMKTHRGD